MLLEVLLGNTAVAAGLAAFVFVVCRGMNLSPAARHALWLIVLLKLMSPVGLLWSVHLPIEEPRFACGGERNQAANAELRDPAQSQHALALEETRASPPELGGNDVAQFRSLEPLPLENIGATAVAGGGNDRLSINVWLLILWLTGAILIAWRCLRQTIRFARFAHSGKQAAPSLQRQVAQLAGQLNVHAPVVRVLGQLPSPVVWCLFRCMLLWPKGLQDRLSGAGRRAVLVHELAHLRRRDHLVRWLELAATVIHWWNPLFWLVRRQLRAHAELACDAWVTGTLPDARRPYAEALLEVCVRSNRAAAPSAAVGIGGEGRDFQRRLTMIMRDRAPCRLAAGAKLFVVLLALAALPAWTLGQGEAKPGAPANDSTAQRQRALDNAKQQDVELEKAAKLMEAKIVELNKQLAELKKRKEAAEARNKDTAQLDLLYDLNMKMAELKKRQQAAEATKKAETGDGGPKFKIWLNQDGKPEQRIGVIVLEDPTKSAPSAESNPKAANVRYKVMRVQEGDGSNDPPIKVGNDVKIVADPLAPPNVGFKMIGAEQGAVNIPQVKVIGPDGKEIKNVKVLISNGDAQCVPKSAGPEGDGKFLFKVQTGPGAPVIKVDPKKPGDMVYIRTPSVAGGSASKPVILARVTYKLPKDKAEALAGFLKANVNSSVIEFRLEEGALTITTTPETQAVVGSIVGLMQSDKDLGAYYKALQVFPYPLENIKEKKK